MTRCPNILPLKNANMCTVSRPECHFAGKHSAKRLNRAIFLKKRSVQLWERQFAKSCLFHAPTTLPPDHLSPRTPTPPPQTQSRNHPQTLPFRCGGKGVWAGWGGGRAGWVSVRFESHRTSRWHRVIRATQGEKIGASCQILGRHWQGLWFQMLCFPGKGRLVRVCKQQ